VRVLEVKIFGLCFGYLRSQFMRSHKLRTEVTKTQSKHFYLQHSHKLRTEVTKTQIKDFYHQNSHKLRTKVTKHKTKNLCFVFLLPLFSICESAGGKNVCFEFWLPPFSIYERKQRFLPPALSQIENRGNKTQNKDYNYKNSHKLKTEVTCFVFWLPPFSICESAGGKNL
jgi:hypothetical protein